jgi:hypothetical protein
MKVRRELVRVYRNNGWPKFVIVKEKNAICYTVLADVHATGSLKAALKYVRSSASLSAPGARSGGV